MTLDGSGEDSLSLSEIIGFPNEFFVEKSNVKKKRPFRRKMKKKTEESGMEGDEPKFEEFDEEKEKEVTDSGENEEDK